MSITSSNSQLNTVTAKDSRLADHINLIKAVLNKYKAAVIIKEESLSFIYTVLISGLESNKDNADTLTKNTKLCLGAV